jgi:lipid-A-disaccharide synthase
MKYYIIAGEASGDLHGANLMRALRHHDGDAQFRFWGGDAMQEVAGTPVRHIRDLAIMGFVEVVMHLSTVLGNIRFCKQDILQYKPDVLVTIDYPGFNLKMAQFAHQHGIRTVHYISPQLWAWKKGRINGMRHSLDKLCYILPFEQDFYAKNDFPQAVYVGHPLLDAVARFREDTTDTLNYGKPIIALLPGSRQQEIKRVLPTMLNIADRHADYQFVIAGMTLIGDKFYQDIIGNRSNIAIIKDQTYRLLGNAYAAVVCSGTATLETALFNVPQVVCYRANAISVAIARRLIGTRIKYISLVNLIADRPIVTELIQDDLNLDQLEKEFARITNTETRQQMLDDYAYLHTLLGNAGASDRTALEIINTLT